MPKRISDRPEVNQAALEMTRRTTVEPAGTQRPAEITSEVPKESKPTKYDISRVMAEMGSKGGRIGGKRRLETMTKAERKTIATKAAKARWNRAKKT
jgi:hypothetical protein